MTHRRLGRMPIAQLGLLACAPTLACSATLDVPPPADAPRCEFRLDAPSAATRNVPLFRAPCELVSFADLNVYELRDETTLMVRFVFDGSMDPKRRLRLSVEGRSAADESLFRAEFLCADGRFTPPREGWLQSLPWNQEFVHVPSEPFARTRTLRFAFERIR